MPRTGGLVWARPRGGGRGLTVDDLASFVEEARAAGVPGGEIPEGGSGRWLWLPRWPRPVRSLAARVPPQP